MKDDKASISELNLMPKTKKALNRIGVKTIGDLVKYSEFELFGFRGFGIATVGEITKKLAIYGGRRLKPT